MRPWRLNRPFPQRKFHEVVPFSHALDRSRFHPTDFSFPIHFTANPRFRASLTAA